MDVVEDRETKKSLKQDMVEKGEFVPRYCLDSARSYNLDSARSLDSVATEGEC